MDESSASLNTATTLLRAGCTRQTVLERYLAALSTVHNIGI